MALNFIHHIISGDDEEENDKFIVTEEVSDPEAEILENFDSPLHRYSNSVMSVPIIDEESDNEKGIGENDEMKVRNNYVKNKALQGSEDEFYADQSISPGRRTPLRLEETIASSPSNSELSENEKGDRTSEKQNPTLISPSKSRKRFRRFKIGKKGRWTRVSSIAESIGTSKENELKNRSHEIPQGSIERKKPQHQKKFTGTWIFGGGSRSSMSSSSMSFVYNEKLLDECRKKATADALSMQLAVGTVMELQHHLRHCHSKIEQLLRERNKSTRAARRLMRRNIRWRERWQKKTHQLRSSSESLSPDYPRPPPRRANIAPERSGLTASEPPPSHRKAPLWQSSDTQQHLQHQLESHPSFQHLPVTKPPSKGPVDRSKFEMKEKIMQLEEKVVMEAKRRAMAEQVIKEKDSLLNILRLELRNGRQFRDLRHPRHRRSRPIDAAHMREQTAEFTHCIETSLKDLQRQSALASVQTERAACALSQVRMSLQDLGLVIPPVDSLESSRSEHLKHVPPDPAERASLCLKELDEATSPLPELTQCVSGLERALKRWKVSRKSPWVATSHKNTKASASPLASQLDSSPLPSENEETDGEREEDDVHGFDDEDVTSLSEAEKESTQYELVSHRVQQITVAVRRKFQARIQALEQRCMDLDYANIELCLENKVLNEKLRQRRSLGAKRIQRSQVVNSGTFQNRQTPQSGTESNASQNFGRPPKIQPVSQSKSESPSSASNTTPQKKRMLKTFSNHSMSNNSTDASSCKSSPRAGSPQYVQWKALNAKSSWQKQLDVA